MSTIDSPTLPLRSRQSTRNGPIGVGIVLAAVGSVIALGGGGVLALTGTDGSLESGTHELSTSTSALTSGVARIDHTDDIATVAGSPTLRLDVSAAQGNPDAFVGVGPKREVDRYLAGSATEEVTDLEVSPWSLDKERHPGKATPKSPAEQTFWSAKSSGRTASIDWKVRDGDYRVVVMNADGSRGVSTDGDIELELPHVGTIALVSLLIGLGTVAGGVVLMTGVPKRRSQDG